MSALPLSQPADQITPEAIDRLVEAFYGRARQDEILGPIFDAGVQDWTAHLAHIGHFWRVVMLGEGRFGGNPMGAHARHPIRPEMFDRWLALWAATAAEVFSPEVAAAFVDRAEQIARSLKLGLFFRPALAEGRA